MFFERLVHLIKENNLTFAQIERELGFSNGSMARWAKSSPSVDKVQKVADYFNVSVDYLLGRTDDPKGEAEVKLLGYVDDQGEQHKFDDLTGEELQKLMEFADLLKKAREK